MPLVGQLPLVIGVAPLHAFPSAVLVMTFLSFFIGIFLQLMWEELPITEPLLASPFVARLKGASPALNLGALPGLELLVCTRRSGPGSGCDAGEALWRPALAAPYHHVPVLRR